MAEWPIMEGPTMLKKAAIRGLVMLGGMLAMVVLILFFGDRHQRVF